MEPPTRTLIPRNDGVYGPFVTVSMGRLSWKLRKATAQLFASLLPMPEGVRELDVTDAEAKRLGGRPVARRGRRPKTGAR